MHMLPISCTPVHERSSTPLIPAVTTRLTVFDYRPKPEVLDLGVAQGFVRPNGLSFALLVASK